MSSFLGGGGGSGGSGTVTEVDTDSSTGITGGPITTTGTVGALKASTSQFGVVKPDGTTITASAGVLTAVEPSGANPSATAGPTAINGSAATFMRSDGAPAIQKASASQFGIVEVDGTTITASGGVISATGGGGLPLAGSNLTYYVATTGSDSNPGTIGSPFATPAHALSVVASFDWTGGFAPIINVADGTYITGSLFLPFLVNCTGIAQLLGDTSTPANCILDGNNSSGAVIGTTPGYQSQQWVADGFQLQNASFGLHINGVPGTIFYDDLVFVTGSTKMLSCLIASLGTFIQGWTNFEIQFQGTSTVEIYNMQNVSGHEEGGATLIFNTSITCLIVAFEASIDAYLGVGAGGITNPGNVVGKQYLVRFASTLDWNGGGSDRSTVPGTVVGSISKNSIFTGDALYQVSAPSNGNTVSTSPGLSKLVVNPAATLATLTIDFPTFMSDGETFDVGTSQQLSSLTFAATDGSSIVGAPTTLGAATGCRFVYDRNNTTWYIN